MIKINFADTFTNSYGRLLVLNFVKNKATVFVEPGIHLEKVLEGF